MESGHKTSKIIPLEALRGIAALVVVFYHFSRVFASPFESYLQGTPFYVCINGIASVVIFFVLSGYVLALRWRRKNAVTLILETALKRWLRLMPPVLVSVMLSWMLFANNLYYFDQFKNHAIIYYSKDARYALYAGVYGIFFSGEIAFNEALWTMPFEFYGSLLVLSLALLMTRAWLHLALCIMLPFCIIACYALDNFILASHLLIWFLPLVAGMMMTMINIENLRLNKYAIGSIVLFSLYMCGYNVPSASYGWVQLFASEKQEKIQVFIQTIGASGLLFVFGSQNGVSHYFTGKISLWLGRISFPLYVLHFLVLYSIAAFVYLRLGSGGFALVCAVITTFLALAPGVYLLTRFDMWWLRTLAAWKPLQK